MANGGVINGFKELTVDSKKNSELIILQQLNSFCSIQM